MTEQISVRNGLSPSVPSEASPHKDVTYLKLGSITPDLRQPRQWMPIDLRQGLGKTWKTGADAMLELLKRAGAGDLEAQGYVKSLKTFAEEIMDVGLQVPISVYLLPEGQSFRYQIKQGERRWWACLYLAAKEGYVPEEALATTIEAFVCIEDETLSADELRRMQWSENLFREEVPLIDIVGEVARAYDSAYARTNADRKAVLAFLKWDDEEQAASAIAVAYAQVELQNLMGKSFSRATIFRYSKLEEQVGILVKRLARAYGFGYRELEQLAGLTSVQDQEALAKIWAVKVLDPDGGQKQVGGKPNKVPRDRAAGEEGRTSNENSGTATGRPTRARGMINFCLKVPELLGKSTDRQLAQLTATELQQVHVAVQQAKQALEEYGKRVSATLSRPGLAEK